MIWVKNIIFSHFNIWCWFISLLRYGLYIKLNSLRLLLKGLRPTEKSPFIYRPTGEKKVRKS